MSHTNPKVTDVLLFMESISFLMKSSNDTDPAGRDVILWRNISFRNSIIFATTPFTFELVLVYVEISWFAVLHPW